VGVGAVGTLGFLAFAMQSLAVTNQDYGYDTQHQPRSDDKKPYTTDLDPKRLFDRDPVTGRAR